MPRISRTAVIDALARHVPEIGFGIVDVVHVATADTRCKVSVKTNQPGVDAAQVCIGKGGFRVRAAATTLALDSMSIVTYSEDPTTYLANAIGAHNITPLSVTITDSAERHARIVFDTTPTAGRPSPYVRAIGARGLNVRLASFLTGWHIQLCTPLCTTDRCIHPTPAAPRAIAS